MIEDIQELNFPKIGGEQYATLTQATVTLQDMADKTITSQVRIDGQITPDFSFDWEVAFQGEKYIMPLRQPQGAKENTSLNSTIDLTFQHWAIYQLKRWYFFTLPERNAGTAVPDQYIASVSLNLGGFCDLLSKILDYYYGDKITLKLNPDWKYASEPTMVEISHSYIWDVLIKLYDLYAVRWVIEPNGDIDHYVIKVGYNTTEISHIFEYGFEGGLLKVERQVQDENIRNMIIGRGGSKNLPYRYFKKHDDNNASFSPDPDWIPELANMPFTELYGATFRSYIQGWKTKHYGGASVTGANKAYAPWAWMRGYTDAKFNPVEYVADEFSIDNNGYGVVKDSSIAKHGELQGGLDNNEDIYPTIQGVVIDPYGRIDEAVEVGKIESDETVEIVPESRLEYLPDIQGQVAITGNGYVNVSLTGTAFTIYDGEHGNLDEGMKFLSLSYSQTKTKIVPIDGKWTIKKETKTIAVEDYNVVIEDALVTVENVETGEIRSASGIPAGTYRPKVDLRLRNLDKRALNVEVKCGSPRVTISKTGDEIVGNTWNLWVKNLWDTEQEAGESDVAYAERVWGPILGDHLGNEAKIVFSDGWLSTSEDYEFTIVSIPVYDTSKELGGVASHWKLTLSKSDADFESTGLLLPSTRRQAQAGDHFFFIGIDMPHMYVVKAEERLDDWKKDELAKVKEVKPTWVVGLDKVRINRADILLDYDKFYLALEKDGLLLNEDGSRIELEQRTARLIDFIRIGSTFTLYDSRFIQGSHQEQLYLQSITYNYVEPTDKEANILPDVEIVLSDKYEVVANPVETLQGEISALQKQIGGSVSNVEQVVRKVGDKIYLRKDKNDRAAGRIELMQGFDSYKDSKLRGDTQFGAEFAEGITGFGGKIDKSGNGWLGGLHLREFLEVPELRYNRTEISIGNVWNAPGGGVIEKVDIESPTTGIVTLHLEDGEIGAVHRGDLCMGIFHDSVDLTKNATEDVDDGRGNFKFAGFHTVYFRILEVDNKGRNQTFHYVLRSESENWKSQFHPSAQMAFVCYGNTIYADRQTSRYATRTYERYLKNVTDWEFTSDNIGAQFGDLSNLSLFGLEMSGYSAYLNNIYMTGRIAQIDNAPLEMVLKYDGDPFINENEQKEVVCRVFKGFEDVTDSVTQWSARRESSNLQADEFWNKEPHVAAFSGAIAIGYIELGEMFGDDPEATFRFTAYIGDEVVASSLTLRGTPQDGKPGLQGCVYRMTQWVAGTEYRNDSDNSSASGLRYVDVVVIPTPTLATKAAAYMCKAGMNHVAIADNAPGTSGGEAYWDKLNDMAPIYTPFLLADGAAITLLQSNQVLVMKDDGSEVNAALGGGKYPLWVGHSDPTQANFYVDDEGKARMSAAEIEGKITAGIAGGQRVELQPIDQRMAIYDKNGEEVSSFEGNQYLSLSKLFSSTHGSFRILNRELADLGFDAGTPYSRGQYQISGNDETTVRYLREIAISDYIPSETPIEVSASGYMNVLYSIGYDEAPESPLSNGSNMIIDGSSKQKYASASLALYVNTYSDQGLTQLVGSQSIAYCRRGILDFRNFKAKTPSGGYHVLVLRIELNASGSVMNASVYWGNVASGRIDISASFTSDFYVSRYFANGFCLGQSAKNYIWAYNQGVESGMRFVMENNGYGVELSNNGIRHKHHDGDWMGMPLFLFKGRYTFNTTTESYQASYTKSFNSQIPQVSRPAVGHVRFVFPEYWKTSFKPSESNLIINVVGFGTIAKGSNPIKATVWMLTSDYIEIALSDDASENDGGFMISMFLLE